MTTIQNKIITFLFFCANICGCQNQTTLNEQKANLFKNYGIGLNYEINLDQGSSKTDNEFEGKFKLVVPKSEEEPLSLNNFSKI